MLQMHVLVEFVRDRENRGIICTKNALVEIWLRPKAMWYFLSNLLMSNVSEWAYISIRKKLTHLTR